ncbi:hypothetical protein BC828DRAFT_414338 [Blastocladiella britannica]|nr:hypothetical protein BC828DRAFT_414338 [Blastocladiella britannica]
MASNLSLNEKIPLFSAPTPATSGSGSGDPPSSPPRSILKSAFPLENPAVSPRRGHQRSVSIEGKIPVHRLSLSPSIPALSIISAQTTPTKGGASGGGGNQSPNQSSPGKKKSRIGIDEDDGFDWYHGGIDDDETLSGDLEQVHGGQMPNMRWTCLPSETLANLSMFLGLLSACTTPALIAWAINPNIFRESMDLIRANEAILWSIFLDLSLVVYHFFWIGFRVVIRLFKAKARTHQLARVGQVEQLSPWIRAVLVTLALFVCQFTVYWLGCDTLNRCGPAAWWVLPMTGSMLATFVLLLLEKIVMQRVANSFHRARYSERLKSLKRHEHTVETLISAKKARKRHGSNSNYSNNLGVTTSNSGDVVVPIPADSDTRSIVSGVFLPLAVDGKSSLGTRRDTRKLARSLFHFLAGSAAYLTIESLEQHLTAVDAEAFFAIFDLDRNKQISKREWLSGLLGVHQERRNLTGSLGQLEHIVGHLNRIAMSLCLLIAVFIWLLCFQVNISNIWVSLTSMLLAGTFIFGQTAKGAFESLIFHFAVHPFDIGDRILVDGDGYGVESVGLTCTILKKADGHIVYFPNSLLLTKVIANTKRAGDMVDAIELDVNFESFSGQHFVLLKTALTEYLQRESAEWTGKFDLIPNELIENGHRLRLRATFQGRGSFIDGARRWQRKVKLLFFMREFLLSLGVIPLSQLPSAPPVSAGSGPSSLPLPLLSMALPPSKAPPALLSS